MAIITPIVSVVIPHFNRAEIVTCALKSIMRQSFQDWECLIVDDGSDKAAKDYILGFITESKDKRFSFLERSCTRAKGANACRNLGAEHSNGKYVAFLDSDDSWLEDYLEDAVNFAEINVNFKASYSGAVVLRDDKRKVISSRAISSHEKLFDFILSQGVLAQTSSYFIKKDIVLEITFDECLKRHQDYDFFIRLGKKYEWCYNPSCKSVIDWSTIGSRKTDFNSCITVYERHKDEFTPGSSMQTGYLISYLGMALRENAHEEVVNYYQREMKMLRYKKTPGLFFMVNYPYLFRFYKKAINLLK